MLARIFLNYDVDNYGLSFFARIRLHRSRALSRLPRKRPLAAEAFSTVQPLPRREDPGSRCRTTIKTKHFCGTPSTPKSTQVPRIRGRPTNRAEFWIGMAAAAERRG